MTAKQQASGRRLAIYLDTTVWNFSFVEDARRYKKETLEFFEKARRGVYDIYHSVTLMEEVGRAPEGRRKDVLALLAEIRPQMLPMSTEVEALANLYLERGALPKRSKLDAMHVAHATVHNMDILVSWNFRHLANINRRNRMLAINLEQGYGKSLDIVTPLEVLGHEDRN